MVSFHRYHTDWRMGFGAFTHSISAWFNYADRRILANVTIIIRSWSRGSTSSIRRMPRRSHAFSKCAVSYIQVRSSRALIRSFGNSSFTWWPFDRFYVFRYEQKEADLLRSLNETEIEKEDETSTLFRGASLTTAIMDLYMKSICTNFLQVALKDTISKLLESKISCEVS